MEGRFCVYVVDVSIFINIVVSCSLPSIEIESWLELLQERSLVIDTFAHDAPLIMIATANITSTDSIVNRMAEYMGF
jgi:hypothetical protein